MHVPKDAVQPKVAAISREMPNPGKISEVPFPGSRRISNLKQLVDKLGLVKMPIEQPNTTQSNGTSIMPVEVPLKANTHSNDTGNNPKINTTVVNLEPDEISRLREKAQREAAEKAFEEARRAREEAAAQQRKLEEEAAQRAAQRAAEQAEKMKRATEEIERKRNK